VLAGRVEIRDFWENKSKYFDHSWIKAPKKWIDPLKESSATKTALATGVKTYQEVAAENGHDWRQQIDDMAEVSSTARRRGST
jgi:capsid protein